MKKGTNKQKKRISRAKGKRQKGQEESLEGKKSNLAIERVRSPPFPWGFSVFIGKYWNGKVKVKQSRYRPGVAHRVQGS